MTPSLRWDIFCRIVDNYGDAGVRCPHALPSPHPRLPLTRWFYFPGFTPSTGGLLREERLLAMRDAFRRDRSARQRMWRSVDAHPAHFGLTVSLFCYSNPALPALLDA